MNAVGHAQDQDPLGSGGRRAQAVATKGHGAPGLDPSAAVGRRNGFWAAPAQYVKDMPKKMRPPCAGPSLKAGRQVVVVDGLAMEAPKTKQAIPLLKALGVDGQRVGNRGGAGWAVERS